MLKRSSCLLHQKSLASSYISLASSSLFADYRFVHIETVYWNFFPLNMVDRNTVMSFE